MVTVSRLVTRLTNRFKSKDSGMCHAMVLTAIHASVKFIYRPSNVNRTIQAASRLLAAEERELKFSPK